MAPLEKTGSVVYHVNCQLHQLRPIMRRTTDSLSCYFVIVMLIIPKPYSLSSFLSLLKMLIFIPKGFFFVSLCASSFLFHYYFFLHLVSSTDL